MKKYPLSFIFTFEMITLFGGIVLWRFLDYFDIINDKLSPILGGILGVFGFLGLFFIFKFWNEFYQIEKKTRIKKFQKKLSKNNNILLVAQRNILANVSFIFGAISIYVFWLLLFPAPGLLGAGYWIARGISIIWFSYGLIFSCFILKKKIVYSKGNLNIRHDDGLEFIPILEVKRIKFIQIENGKAGLRPLEAQLLLFNGEILKCSNIDKIVFFEEKFEIIKQYVKLKYEVKGKDEYE